MNSEQIIESVLFFKNEPVSEVELAKLVNLSTEELSDGLNKLEHNLQTRGVRLVRNGKEVALASAPEASALIEKLTKEELSKDLGKASLETLAIILYRGPLSRSEIDYIRGVNSSFILRNLMIRGLINREVNVNDQRSFIYRPTTDLLSNLGVSKVEDLPEYSKVINDVDSFTDKMSEAQ